MSSAIFATKGVPDKGDIMIQGIRHLNNHESVFCVLHIDKDAKKSAENELMSNQSNDNKTTYDNTISDKPKKKISSMKSVSFGDISVCSCDDLSTTNKTGSTNSSNSSLSGEEESHKDRGSTMSNNNGSKKQMKQGLSSHHQRHKTKNVPLKPSPLLADTTHVAHDSDSNSGATGSPFNYRRSLDSLGLSPATRRRGTINSPALDELSNHSGNSQRSKKHSWPTKEHSSTSETPLHSGFIGSEEELEKLRFIKHALSANAVPITPEMFRKRSNTHDGAPDQRRLNYIAEDFRARVSSLDSSRNKAQIKSRHLVGSPKINKERLGSADH